MPSPATETVAVFGLPVSSFSTAQAVERIEHLLHTGRTHQVATADLAFVRHALSDPYLQRVLCDCALVLPDALPLLWASAILGTPLRQRVPAAALVRALAALAARKGYPVFFLGETEETTRAAITTLQREYPALPIAGHYATAGLPLHHLDHDSLLASIDASGAALLLVDFRHPMQQAWIYRHRDLLKVPVAVGVGRAFAAIASTRPAPPMASETASPRPRFSRRILTQAGSDLLTLALHLPLALLAARLQPGKSRVGASFVQVEGAVRVLTTPATLGSAACVALLREARHAVIAGQTLVFDLSSTVRVEPEGLGCLLEARRILLAEGLWIWLAGMSNPVRRLLQFSSLSGLFRIAASAAEAVYFTSAAHRPVAPASLRSLSASKVTSISVARIG